VPVATALRAAQYAADELRRLAFISRLRSAWVWPLSTSAAVLDAPGRQWRQTVRQQIAELDQVIAQARAAMFLTHALDRPTEHPARQCPTMIAALDRPIDGATVEQLVAEHRPGDQRDEGPEG
jgi:hypothetical protein